ncbi:MAG: hypothetical protein HOE90_17280 [Bacteriovoracaceae bacterium]|nr:hypothetical protein [Bacteriovoracaceae bacterium]
MNKYFTGKLGQYEQIQTEDGSQSMINPYFSEGLHSIAGAKTETLFQYWEGCQMEAQFLSRSSISLLEVGFGMGTGLLATLEQRQKLQAHVGSPLKLNYLSFELDDLLVEHSLNNYFKNIFEKVELITTEQYSYYSLRAPNFEGTILLGNGREVLPSFLKQTSHPPFTAIYQDAFSPRRNPSLWTTQWFDTLREFSSSDVILSTYSSSFSIRKSMLLSGFSVMSAKGYGRKKFSTRAYLTGESDPEILSLLENDKLEALYDCQLNGKI